MGKRQTFHFIIRFLQWLDVVFTNKNDLQVEIFPGLCKMLTDLDLPTYLYFN